MLKLQVLLIVIVLVLYFSQVHILLSQDPILSVSLSNCCLIRHIPVLRILSAEGTPLSVGALKRITVLVRWPDGVITRHRPGIDGTVGIVLNKNTIVSWPIDISRKYNPESPLPQTPPGVYTVIVLWEGIPKPIYEGTIVIYRARYEIPKFASEVLVAVYDLSFRLLSPFGSPLASAKLELVKLDGTRVTTIADLEGLVKVPEVPLGRVRITRVIWKGVDITEYGMEPVEVTLETRSVVVKGVGRLTIRVIGAFRQPDTETVTIEGPGVFTKTVRVEGSWSEEVPAGTYTVAGRSVEVKAGEEAVVAVTTGRIFGWPISTILIWIVGIIILATIIAILIYEYTSWRYMRKIARVAIPAKISK